MVVTCLLAVACGGSGAATPIQPARSTEQVAPVSRGTSFIPDYIGPYATSGALADEGSVRLLSNGNVHVHWGDSARLLAVRPWGRIEVSCTRRTPRAAFRLSTTAKGESAVVQTVASRLGHPLALVPIQHQGSPIILPRSGPHQRLSTMQLSVATEAISVAGTFLVTVQWNSTGCESATTAVLVTHRS